MNSDIGAIITMVILVAFSAYFSATETAFSSLNRARIKSRAEDGDRRAALVLRLSEQYDKLLSTILIGNNIVNISLASIGTICFIRWLGNDGATVSTVVITVVVLIFGEISPKSLAKESPESFAGFSAPILRIIMVIFTPLSFLFSAWKKLLSKMFSVKDNSGVTEDELLIIVEEAQNGGGINKKEGELIRSAIEFNEHAAKDILVPRVDVEGIPVTATKEEIAEILSRTNYSRLPVYEESLDHIVGILLEKDFYNRVYTTKVPVKEIIKPAVFVSENMKISDLLHLLQRSKSLMAVVSDEYGGTVGIVTMEDILEELVGEIWDEHDEIVEEIKPIGKDKYRVLCTVGLDKLLNYFHIKTEPEASSVNGWVMEQLGKIPEVGDLFIYGRLTVTVKKVQKRRAEVLEIVASPEVTEDE